MNPSCDFSTEGFLRRLVAGCSFDKTSCMSMLFVKNSSEYGVEPLHDVRLEVCDDLYYGDEHAE